ncbi:MAG TPA: response regulator transcription factor, partial [Nitrospiria bacterium]
SPDFSPGVLRKAIETVIRGEHWVSRKVAGRMFSEVFGLEKEKETPAADHDLLTRRELEILSLVSRGCRNKEIGEALSISEKTVKTHLTNIFGKLNIQNRLQAALYANRVFPGNNRGHYQAAV